MYVCRAVVELAEVPLFQQARDQLRLVTMRARLGYVLIGLLGEKGMERFGYPQRNATEILHTVLHRANTKV